MEDQPRCTRAKLGAHLFEGGMRRAMQAQDMAMVEGLAQVENSEGSPSQHACKAVRRRAGESSAPTCQNGPKGAKAKAGADEVLQSLGDLRAYLEVQFGQQAPGRVCGRLEGVGL
ncbi:hypothetical protein AK812_SmicGene46678 [Symbiodinium microadriaticum]|uniref:Uncharacterized protein n=1 Tax=Symbiodinium microadriaticum TaxID=2951 RepID=A0A1Q9BTB8_SYMMI|nr:hypothetical protein AK812_SmicGene46678 [Symbiodinium microadriaticum]